MMSFYIPNIWNLCLKDLVLTVTLLSILTILFLFFLWERGSYHIQWCSWLTSGYTLEHSLLDLGNHTCCWDWNPCWLHTKQASYMLYFHVGSEMLFHCLLYYIVVKSIHNLCSVFLAALYFPFVWGILQFHWDVWIIFYLFAVCCASYTCELKFLHFWNARSLFLEDGFLFSLSFNYIFCSLLQ